MEAPPTKVLNLWLQAPEPTWQSVRCLELCLLEATATAPREGQQLTTVPSEVPTLLPNVSPLAQPILRRLAKQVVPNTTQKCCTAKALKGQRLAVKPKKTEDKRFHNDQRCQTPRRLQASVKAKTNAKVDDGVQGQKPASVEARNTSEAKR